MKYCDVKTEMLKTIILNPNFGVEISFSFQIQPTEIF